MPLYTWAASLAMAESPTCKAANFVVTSWEVQTLGSDYNSSSLWPFFLVVEVITYY